MKAVWIPDNCIDILADSTIIDFPVLVNQCRHHNSFLSKKKNLMGELCAYCYKNKSTNLHHVQPLWALAVQFICDGLLHGENRGVLTISPDEYREWNGYKNLKPICDQCHCKIESVAERGWRETIIKKYYPHLFFSFSDARKTLKKQ